MLCIWLREECACAWLAEWLVALEAGCVWKRCVQALEAKHLSASPAHLQGMHTVAGSWGEARIAPHDNNMIRCVDENKGEVK